MRYRMKVLAWCFGALGASLGPACGSEPDPSGPASFPEAPYTIVESEQKLLTVEVRTGPGQPPARGYTDVELVVHDATGALVDDLEVGVTPWMPLMGHGTNVVPTVHFEGHGHYVIKNVTMHMAGRWELRTTFAGAVRDSVTPVFDVL